MPGPPARATAHPSEPLQLARDSAAAPRASGLAVRTIDETAVVEQIGLPERRVAEDYGLGELAKSDPELATRRWEEIQQAARAELSSGHRAARAVREGLDG